MSDHKVSRANEVPDADELLIRRALAGALGVSYVQALKALDRIIEERKILKVLVRSNQASIKARDKRIHNLIRQGEVMEKADL